MSLRNQVKMYLSVEKTVGSEYSFSFHQNSSDEICPSYLFNLLQLFNFCELGTLVAKFPYSGVF